LTVLVLRLWTSLRGVVLRPHPGYAGAQHRGESHPPPQVAPKVPTNEIANTSNTYVHLRSCRWLSILCQNNKHA
jgi:hypothetical protein